jgi:ABC-type arginine/histidine transport system permease subunit
MSGKMARTLLAVIRSVVFLLGLLFGLLYSMLIGLASAAAQFVGVFGGLALAIAAPPCWWAATRSKAGDRITLIYVVSWMFMIAVMSLVGLLDRGKVVRTGTHAGVLALCLVAAVYLVAVPLVVHRYRQREERTCQA